MEGLSVRIKAHLPALDALRNPQVTARARPQGMRSGGRVVEGARLESVYTSKAYRGFESHPLRHFGANRERTFSPFPFVTVNHRFPRYDLIQELSDHLLVDAE